MDWALAIDFGTTFTTAALEADGRIEVLEMDNSRYLPSTVCLDPDGRLLIGRDAVNEATYNPSRAERLPKRAMANARHVRLGGQTMSTVDLVAAVLRRVAEEASRRRGDREPGRVVLTHPARWQTGGVELARLVAAAERAGLRRPDLVAEPVAAAHYYADDPDARVPDGAAIAVYDLGGGTLDTAVLRRRGDGFVLAGPPGGEADLGGEDLDGALMEVLAGHAEAWDAPQWARTWEEPGRAADRNRTLLRREVCQAKESLSHRTTVNIYVPGFDDEIRITRGEYEAAISESLGRSVAELVDTIARAGCSPESLAATYLTGGSSRTPRITTLLSARLGRLPVTQDDPKAVVAQGALRAAPGSVGVRPTTGNSGAPGSASGRAYRADRAASSRPVESGEPAARSRQLDSLAREITDAAAAAGAADVAARVLGAGRPAAARGSVLTVTGAPRTGKTTLLNALLGADVLPYDPVPCTDPSITVRWGERAEALLFATPETTEPESLSLRQLAALTGAEASGRPARARAEIRFPADLLGDGVVLVDHAAGVGSSPRPDLLVHIVDVTTPGPVPSERGRLGEVVVLTKLDLVDASRRDGLRQDILDRWRWRYPGVDEDHVVLDARRALRSRLRNHVGGWRSSGGAHLFQILRDVVDGSSCRPAALSEQLLRTVLDEVNAAVAARHGPPSSSPLRQGQARSGELVHALDRLERAATRLDELRRTAS